MWSLYALTWTWCSFSINTALGIALALLRLLNFNEGDPVPTRALSYLNMTLTAAYPPQPNIVHIASEVIKVFHGIIISMPVALLEPVVFAVQTGLAVWIEDTCMSLSEDQYNDLVRDLSFSSPASHLVYFFSAHVPLRFASHAATVASPIRHVFEFPRSASHRRVFAHPSASAGSSCVYTFLQHSTCPSCCAPQFI